MTTIKIDGVDFEIQNMTEEAKTRLASVRFCDAELRRLQREVLSMRLARNSYARALKAELDKPDPKAAQEIMETVPINVNDTASPPEKKKTEQEKKKGLFGLFSK